MSITVDGTNGITVPKVTSAGLVDISGAAAGQIKFPAAQNASADANTLDDYEEGTWTPSANCLSGSITSYTSSGTYTKVGRLVTLQGVINLTNVGTASSQMTVGSLPFAASGASGAVQYQGTCREVASSGVIYYAYINTAGIYVQNATNGGITWTNSYSYSFSLTYFTST